MALMPCPECEGVVSEHAPTCPHCGYPILVVGWKAAASQDPAAGAEVIAATRSMIDEQTLYGGPDQAGPWVTSRRVVVGGQTHRLSGIRSIGFKRVAPDHRAAVTIFMMGAVAAILGIVAWATMAWALVCGLGICGLALLLMKKTNPYYVATTLGEAGAQDVFVSTDKAQVQALVEAINQAFVLGD